MQGVFHQIGDAPGAQDDHSAFCAFPHDAADSLQAFVGGMEFPGGDGKFG